MPEISLDYWNKLAYQTILISSLMSGFSIAVVINLMIYQSNNRFAIYTQKAATIAAGAFLVSIFAWTKVLMMTTESYPFNFMESELTFPRLVGGLALILGVLSLSFVLSFSGWIRSKQMGIFTTIVGVLTFLMFILMGT